MLAPFSSPRDLWEANSSALLQRLGEKEISLLNEARANYDPDKEMENLAKFDVGYMTIYDKEYPPSLKQAPDCPVILYIKGNPMILKGNIIGIVGSRKYSSYGQKYAYKFAKELSQNGLTVASGMALGIDAFAHSGAVDGGGLTIGVLGCGLDKIYPVSNFQVGQDIIKSGGALISEFPLGTPPMKQNFPARNRIIAGLSLGVLVIEAAAHSGALITAYQALEYNREVFALPGNIDNENSQGTNRLIKEGANLVETSADILAALNIEKHTLGEKAKELLPESEDEKKICEALQKGGLLIDEIVRETKISIVAVNSGLTFLEMKGLAENLGGGRYKLM